MKPEADIAVVLLSGGLDSCVTAALAARSHRLAVLHAGYGQRTERRERKAFEEIADHFGVARDLRLVARLEHAGAIGGSALTSRDSRIPEGPPGEGIPETYVPFRNGQLLAAGVAWAEVLGARSVWIGAVEEDSSGYPDCRAAFLEAFERAVRLGTRDGERLRIVAPLVRMSKREIVRQGLDLGAPLGRTWSCYRGEERACGRCESCWLRRRAFDEAGAVDPLPYDA